MMTTIKMKIFDNELEEYKDLLRTCIETRFPFVDNQVAENFLREIEEGEE